MSIFFSNMSILQLNQPKPYNISQSFFEPYLRMFRFFSNYLQLFRTWLFSFWNSYQYCWKQFLIFLTHVLQFETTGHVENELQKLNFLLKLLFLPRPILKYYCTPRLRINWVRLSKHPPNLDWTALRSGSCIIFYQLTQ